MILRNSLFGAVRENKNADPDKYVYSGYGTAFDARSAFSFSSGDRFGKNLVIFGVNNSSSVYDGNRNKDILNFGKGRKDKWYYSNSRG